MLRSVLRAGLSQSYQTYSAVPLSSNAKQWCRTPQLIFQHKSFHVAHSLEMAKRKRSSIVQQQRKSSSSAIVPDPIVPAAVLAAAAIENIPTIPSRRQSTRKSTQDQSSDFAIDTKAGVEDGETALQASPSANGPDEAFEAEGVIAKRGRKKAMTRSAQVKTEPLVDYDDSQIKSVSSAKKPISAKSSVAKAADKDEVVVEVDPENGDAEDADPEELKEAMSRPPPVNSSYLPLPWKGRLGYACLNTYLRTATPPVFSSRTCRIASILEHRHPLKDPTQPEHATKNRPDKDQPPDIARGQAYVESLGLSNAQDIPKMLRWNDKYGIKFLRLSSEMFPFASHDIYGYKLAPFAAKALAEAGRVAAELGHRLTTHPGQFTQLGSPRQEVITASIRDLEFHCELLDLLKLPEQQNRDAVMILHMGGVFGDKTATIARFKENYMKLSQGIKNRLVLENDDVCYSVHDILPVCEELNIPMVLDYHHHNIYFDADEIREGTLDIMNLYDRIKATWDRKRITQKMHYSEPTPEAVTPRQRRKHNPRVGTLPPCSPDMDLMIEAKDKEQAVFALMRTFKLPGYETFNDILPHIRGDENKPWKPPKKKKASKKKGADVDEAAEEEDDPQPPLLIPDEEVAMGGPEGRVFWPVGMEDWLRPKKREVKPRDPEKAKTTSEKAAQRRAEKAAWQAAREASAEAEGSTVDGGNTSTTGTSAVSKPLSAAMLPTRGDSAKKSVYNKSNGPTAKSKPARAPSSTKKKLAKAVLTPSTSDPDENEDDQDEDLDMPDLTDADEEVNAPKLVLQRSASNKKGARAPALVARGKEKGRNAKKRIVSYAEGDDEEE